MSLKKSMLYKKLFFTYTIVIIFLVVIFDVYLINYVHSSNKRNRFYLGQKLGYDVSEVITEIENSNQYIVKNMYYDYMLNLDIIKFLDNKTNDYLKEKLDMFSKNNEFTYRGVENFVEKSFISNDKIINIIFVSDKLEDYRVFNKLNQIHTESLSIPDEGIKNVPKVIFENDKLYYVNDIKDPNNLSNRGKLIVSYNVKSLANLIDKYDVGYDILLMDNNSGTVFGTNAEVTKEEAKLLFNMEDREKLKLDNGINAIKVRFSDEISIIIKVPVKNLIESPVIFYNSIIVLNIIVLMITLSILKIKLEKFTDRTNNLLMAMEEVKGGNLKAKIPIDNEIDEISYISENFNEMCIELDRHINKSYLAEINQKKAEMIALQNQINPHFLYNTLECIRMKAICNGDREVGKMLYNLSFLFRKQVKDNNIITLKGELDYCIKYMEIFKFRYKDKFNFSINCPEEFYDNEMIKFTLQPLIENYFVHGIVLENSDNFIELNIFKVDDDLKIIIDDNGSGIPESRLKEINKQILMDEFQETGDKSIGIVNAQGRIVGAYGKNYGIKLENNNKGARVIVTIPCKMVN